MFHGGCSVSPWWSRQDSNTRLPTPGSIAISPRSPGATRQRRPSRHHSHLFGEQRKAASGATATVVITRARRSHRRVGRAETDDALLDRQRSRRIEKQAPTEAEGEQILDRNRALRGYGVVDRAVPPPQHAAVREFGQQTLHRFIQAQLAVPTSIITAAAVMGLLIEAMRKMLSRLIGGPSIDMRPTGMNRASLPRATTPTMPGAKPVRTSHCKSLSMSCSGSALIHVAPMAGPNAARPTPADTIARRERLVGVMPLLHIRELGISSLRAHAACLHRRPSAQSVPSETTGMKPP